MTDNIDQQNCLEVELYDSSSSDSIGNYTKKFKPQHQNNGQEESPLPANTPQGRKGKLSDPSSFERNMKNSHAHFSLDPPTLRDFQAPDEQQQKEQQVDELITPQIGGRLSMQQPRLRPLGSVPAELRPIKQNSNPFIKFPECESSTSINSKSEEVPAFGNVSGNKTIFIRPPSIGSRNPLGSSSMQRTTSTQYEDKSLDMSAIRQSTIGIIEETNSNEERGGSKGIDMNSNDLVDNNFTKLYGSKKSNTEIITQINTAAPSDALLRTFSNCGNPDSPSEAIKNAQRKEALRKQFVEQSKVACVNYSKLDSTQLQIEGPYHQKDKDTSYSLVNACKELKELERGIPIDPFLLLGDTNKDIFEKSFADFETRLNKRKGKVEHSILNRLNCHKEKFDQLYKNFNHQFLEKNRYPDMLPFKFNRVKFDKFYLHEKYEPLSPTRQQSNSFNAVERKPFTQEPDMLSVWQPFSARPSSQTFHGGIRPEELDENFDDYINASWIDSCIKKQLIIAASAPKENTAADFIQMIMQNNVKLIMKVCEDKVRGRETCFRYTGKVPTTRDDLKMQQQQCTGEQKFFQALGANGSTQTQATTINGEQKTAQIPLVTFKNDSKDGSIKIKYDVFVLSSKTKYDAGILIRKVQVIRKEYRKGADLFQKETDNHNNNHVDVGTGTNASRFPAKRQEEDLFMEESKNIPMSVSTSKADRDEPRFVREDIHYFKQVTDLVWEDQKPPTSRGNQTLNYLRMAYMVKKMIKQSRRQNTMKSYSTGAAEMMSGLSALQNLAQVPEQKILVHCSAGRGRTGTLIAAFIIAEHLLNLSETFFPGESPRESGCTQYPREEPDSDYTDYPDKEELPASLKGDSKYNWSRISIFSIVRRLREQRWCMVSTDLQYQYLHQFMSQWVKKRETASLRATLNRLPKMNI